MTQQLDEVLAAAQSGEVAQVDEQHVLAAEARQRDVAPLRVAQREVRQRIAGLHVRSVAGHAAKVRKCHDLAPRSGPRGRLPGEIVREETEEPPRTRPRGVADVHVWTLTTDEAVSLASVCSRDEHARAERFLRDEDRRSFLAAHGLVRRALSHLAREVAPAAWRFTATEKGRPEVEDGGGLRFNLAHASAWVACVVTRELDCGIDVEAIDRPTDHELLARRTLTRDERRELQAAPEGERPRRFIERWTLKEALAKALGVGLSLAFDETGFTGLPNAITVARADAGDWRLEQWSPDARHVAALAVRHRGAPLAIIHHTQAPGRVAAPPRRPAAPP